MNPNKLKRDPIHHIHNQQSHQKYEEQNLEYSDEELEDESDESNRYSPPEKGLYPIQELKKEKEFLNLENHKKKARRPKKFNNIQDSQLQKPIVVKSNTCVKNNYLNFNNCSLVTWLFFSILISILSVIFYMFFNGAQSNVRTSNGQLNVTELIKNLRSKFNSQPELTFRILQAALKRVVAPKPSAPAIISVLVDKEAYGTAVRFYTHFAQTVAPEKYVFLDENIYGNADYNEIKLKIDKEIKSKVENSSLNVVIVDKFEKIPVHASMIFHSYCDHESALFKNVVYMFVISLDNILPANANQKSLDQNAIYYLKKTWHDADADFIDSLITRITVNVVNIK